VFLDWQFVIGEKWQDVYASVGGKGIPSVFGKFDEMFAMKKEEKKLPSKKPKLIKSQSIRKDSKSRKPRAKPKPLVKKKK